MRRVFRLGIRPRIERGWRSRPHSTATELPQELFGPQVGNRSRRGLRICDPVSRFVIRERTRCLVCERTILRVYRYRVAVLDRRVWHWPVLKQYCVQKSLTGRGAASRAEVASDAP